MQRFTVRLQEGARFLCELVKTFAPITAFPRPCAPRRTIGTDIFAKQVKIVWQCNSRSTRAVDNQKLCSFHQ